MEKGLNVCIAKQHKKSCVKRGKVKQPSTQSSKDKSQKTSKFIICARPSIYNYRGKKNIKSS